MNGVIKFYIVTNPRMSWCKALLKYDSLLRKRYFVSNYKYSKIIFSNAFPNALISNKFGFLSGELF